MPNRLLKYIVDEQELITAEPDATAAHIAKQMTENKIGSVLILERGYLVGIVTERDLVGKVIAAGKSPSHIHAKNIMTHNPMTIEADKQFSHALHIMDDNGFRHLPVTNNGQLIGIVSARDALSLDLKQFEMDNIQKEHIFEVIA